MVTYLADIRNLLKATKKPIYLQIQGRHNRPTLKISKVQAREILKPDCGLCLIEQEASLSIQATHNPEQEIKKGKKYSWPSSYTK